MQFRAIIPAGVRPGDIVRVNAHGVQLSVRVPKQSQPGDPLVFEISKAELMAADVDKLVVEAATFNKTASSSSSPLRRSKSFGNFHDGSSSRLPMPWFCNEFGMALGMAALIALSMVCGFLLGILYVTQPLGPNGEIPPTFLPSTIITPARQGGRTIIPIQRN